MDTNKKQIAREALQALADIEDTVRMEQLVKDNKIEFKIDEKIYRIRKPTFIERQDIDIARRKKYIEMIKDDSFLFRKQWIEQYKTKSIDIVQMERKVKDLQADIEKTLLILAKTIEPKEIEQLKKDVLRLRDEQFSLSMEVTDFLSYSIEDQLVVFVNGYTTYLVLEIQEGEIWKKFYESYDEFKKSDSKIIEHAFYYISYLIYNYIGEQGK